MQDFPQKNGGVSEQLKNLVKALREDAKDNLKELGIRYFYGNLDELTELTEASAPPLEMLVKLTKDFAERFQAKKREKNVLDFSDMEHFALDILLKKEGENYVPARRQESFLKNMMRSCWMSIRTVIWSRRS